MAYVKTNWIEMSMLEADKITALNNMETQYDEITSYATAISHDSRYYNETYCDANFFKASNDLSSILTSISFMLIQQASRLIASVRSRFGTHLRCPYLLPKLPKRRSIYYHS